MLTDPGQGPQLRLTEAVGPSLDPPIPQSACRAWRWEPHLGTDRDVTFLAALASGPAARQQMLWDWTGHGVSSSEASLSPSVI